MKGKGKGKNKKKPDDGTVERTKTMKMAEDNGEETVTEAEVEEFFAILKRIHAATKYFQNKERGGRHFSTAKRWKPSFELADLEDEDKKEEDQKGMAGLDLNLKPDPERLDDPRQRY